MTCDDLIPISQKKAIENRHINTLLGGVNLDYVAVQAQVLSQDPFPLLDLIQPLLSFKEKKIASISCLDKTNYHHYKNHLRSGGRSRGYGDGCGGERVGRSTVLQV